MTRPKMRQISGQPDFVDGDIPVYDAPTDRFVPGASSGPGDSLDDLLPGPGTLIVGDPLGPPYPGTLFPGDDGDVLTLQNDGVDPAQIVWGPPTSGGSGIPESTVTAAGDLIAADGAASVQALPIGTAGQVLTVDLGETVKMRWGTPGGSGTGIPVSTLQNKGDVIVALAEDTPARLSVGSDGQVMVADSADLIGVAWKAAPAAPQMVINTFSGNHILNSADPGCFITMTSASANSLTVPTTSSIPVGSIIQGAQTGAGQTTIVAAGGVTVNAVPGLKVAAQYGTFALIKLTSSVWLAFGRLSA